MIASPLFWQNISPTQRAALALLLAALIWAGWWVLNRHAAQQGMNPYDLLALRLAVAGLVLLPFIVRRGLGVSWPKALFFALIGGVLNSLLAIYGVHFAPASHGAALMPGVGPIFTALLAWLLLNENLSFRRWLGVILVVGGACLIGLENFTQSLPDQWIGHLMFVGSALGWAFYIVLMRLWQVTPWQAAALTAVGGMVIYLPLYMVFGHGLASYSASQIITQGLYQGLLTSVLAVVFFNYGVSILGATGSAVTSGLIPVFTVCLSVIALGELPGLLALLGIGVVVFAAPIAMGLWADKKAPVAADILPVLGQNIDRRV